MKSFVSLLVCVVALLGSVALAQDKGVAPAVTDEASDGAGLGRWWSNPRVAERLGLTAEQKKRIQDIVFKSGERMVDMRAQKEKARLEMLRLLGADALDDARAARNRDGKRAGIGVSATVPGRVHWTPTPCAAGEADPGDHEGSESGASGEGHVVVAVR